VLSISDNGKYLGPQKSFTKL